MSCFVVIVYINQFSIRTSNYYNALKSIMKEREGATVKVLVIHNIGSGHGAGAIYDFIRSYAEDGDTITLRTFNGHTPFATLLEDARDYDFVVASGGDGTIAAVTYELRYSDIPILPFPSGTANLLAMNLSSPNEPHALCKVADQGQTMYFDLGEIETPEASIGFTIMAGCGYDEIIMRHEFLAHPIRSDGLGHEPAARRVDRRGHRQNEDCARTAAHARCKSRRS